MEVFIGNQPTPKDEIFIARRLRKNIKGALELKGIRWIENSRGQCDLEHFLSPNEGFSAREEAKGAKRVVSALYSEYDSSARFLTKDAKGFYQLSAKGKKVLAEADAVFLPSKAALALLLHSGFDNKNVHIVTPGVNLSRFADDDPVENNLFYRYFRFPTNKPYAIIVGSLDDDFALKNAEFFAKAFPFFQFFYFSSASEASASTLKRLNSKNPKNLFFSHPVDDDVYRSALINAALYISFDGGVLNTIGVLEAMAAMTPVILIVPASVGLNENMANGVCIYDTSPEAAAKKMNSLHEEEYNLMLSRAHALAEANSLEVLGEQLRHNYNQLLYQSEVSI